MGFQNRVSSVWCIDVRNPARYTPLQARVQDLTSGTSRRTAPCSSRAPFRRTLAAADRLRLPCLRFLRLRSRLRRKGTGLARVTGAGASFSTCTFSSSSCKQDSSVQAPNGARARASSRRRRRRRWQWTSELHHLQTHPPFHRCTTGRFCQDPLEPSPHPRRSQTHLVEEVFRPTELFLGTILMDGRCGMFGSNATGLETKEPHPRRRGTHRCAPCTVSPGSEDYTMITQYMRSTPSRQLATHGSPRAPPSNIAQRQFLEVEIRVVFHLLREHAKDKGAKGRPTPRCPQSRRGGSNPHLEAWDPSRACYYTAEGHSYEQREQDVQRQEGFG